MLLVSGARLSVKNNLGLTPSQEVISQKRDFEMAFMKNVDW